MVFSGLQTFKKHSGHSLINLQLQTLGKCSKHFPKSEENAYPNIAITSTFITHCLRVFSTESRADAELDFFPNQYVLCLHANQKLVFKQ